MFVCVCVPECMGIGLCLCVSMPDKCLCTHVCLPVQVHCMCVHVQTHIVRRLEVSGLSSCLSLSQQPWECCVDTPPHLHCLSLLQKINLEFQVPLGAVPSRHSFVCGVCVFALPTYWRGALPC